jgi:K(+)-stimulated pyrophosphate-energized sodium pump
MLSTAIPVIVVCVAVLASYYLSGGASNFNAGLYGVAISAVGMLSTLDHFGDDARPIADNAGVTRRCQIRSEREKDGRSGRLGKRPRPRAGFAIGSAALTALARSRRSDQIALWVAGH